MPGKLRDVSVKPLYGKAVGKILLLVGAFLFVTAVSGSDVPMKVFDFEIEDERAALSDKRGHGFIGFKKAYPCSGEWTLAFNPSSWKPGMNEWPSVTVKIPENCRDWRGYEKLSIDVIAAKGGADLLKCYICSGDKPLHEGKSISFTLPERGWKRLEISVDKVAKKIDVSNVTRLHFYMKRPLRSELYIDNIVLLPPVQTLGLPNTREWKSLMEEVADRNAAVAKANEGRRELLISRLRTASEALGRPVESFLLAKATSMEKVRPHTVEEFEFADDVFVRLARNEHEAVQLLVLPVSSELRKVSVKLGAIAENNGKRLPSDSVSIAPVGYVKTVFEPPYAIQPGMRPAETGWWPDPILSFTDAVDVAKGDWQSFWISVSCPEDQPAGTYCGTLEVSADGAVPVEVSLRIRVNGFALPMKAVIPVAVAFNPGCRQHTIGEEASAIRSDPESPMNKWEKRRSEWTDHLADHLIPLFNLYARTSNAYPPSYFDELARLDSQGRLGLFNLGYWSYPDGLSEKDLAEWRKRTIPRLKEAYKKLKERGWQNRACLYGCDEIKPAWFEHVKVAILELKREFPEVPLFTTAYDQNYGMDGGLEGVDWFTPLTERYDLQKADMARSRGKKVWWYIALSPTAPYANMFVEEHAAATRLLMGAMSQKYRPDGFLYYQCAIWNSRRCITSGPYTDWNPRSFGRYHGDGSWTCAGPDGMPLETIRLANFRDGLEDLAYARMLETETGRKTEVPPEIVESKTKYTLDPARIYEWRNRMADELERLIGAGNNSGKRGVPPGLKSKYQK